MNRALKFLKSADEGRIGGYLVVWGSPQQKDLQGEYFTPKTDLGLKWYHNRPMLYHHGIDGSLKAEPIGVIDTLQADEVGVWAEGQLDMHHRYATAIKRLVERGVLGWSSGTLPHLVERDANGNIKRWPIVEGSLTPTPAEPRNTDVATVVSAYKALNLDTSHLKFDETSVGHSDAGEGQANGMDTGVSDSAPPAAETPPVSEQPAQEAHPPATPPADTDSPPATPMESPEPPTEDNTPDDAPPTEGESTPTQTPAQGVSIMEMLDTILQSVLQALGQTFNDEQFAQLKARVSEMVDQRQQSLSTGMGLQTPAPVTAKSLSAAFADKDFAGQVQTAIKSIATGGINPADIANQFAGLMGTGQGGTSRAQGGADGNPATGITGMKTKYERNGLSVFDLSYWYTIGQVVNRTGRSHMAVPNSAMAEMTAKALDLVKQGKLQLEYDDDPDGKIAEARVKSMEMHYLKANELMHTTNTGYGEEWIPDLWLNQVWYDEREDLVVFREFQTIPMPSDPYNLPVEGVDPEMEFVGETTTTAQLDYGANNPLTMQKYGTNKIQISAAKLGLRIGISAEEDEDALIPVIADARRKVMRVLDETKDWIIIGADPSTSGNVNLYDATPGAKKPYMFNAGNGLIKHAFDTHDPGNNAPTLFDAGGLPTLKMMRDLRFQGLEYEFNTKFSGLRYFVDPLTEGALLNIPEFLTIDKFGSNATVLTGQIGAIDGIPVLRSDRIFPSAANGKISNTAANNVRGRAMLVYTPWHKVGFRRNVQIASEYMMAFDAHIMTLFIRMGQKQRSNRYVSMLYNIAV